MAGSPEYKPSPWEGGNGSHSLSLLYSESEGLRKRLEALLDQYEAQGQYSAGPYNLGTAIGRLDDVLDILEAARGKDVHVTTFLRSILPRALKIVQDDLADAVKGL